MILTDVAQHLLQELLESDLTNEGEVEQLIARHPRFQNINYPLALPPLLIDQEALTELREQAESYVKLLEKVIRLYHQDAQIRAFIGLDDVAEQLVCTEKSLTQFITVCRLDGYLEQGTNRLRILENNADSPAGTLFTSRLNQLARELVGSKLALPKLLPMDHGNPFIELLLKACGNGEESRQQKIAVLQIEGHSNVESQEIALELQSLGHDCSVVDPRALKLAGNQLLLGDKAIDLIWNKINTCSWNKLVREYPDILKTFSDLASSPNKTTLINSFSARYVAEAKTSLALLHDPRFQNHFLPQEQELIQRIIPWTARLEQGTTVHFEGDDTPLEDLLLEQKDNLVIKEQYDIRGDGVTIGRSMDALTWKKVIDSLWDTGAVVQRYVQPSLYGVYRIGSSETIKMNISLDSFVFSGQLVGFGSKASTKDKINLFQGGSKLPVFLVPR